ncbi:MAG: PorV/PorQ family protein [Saprospiraceae bacterium]
MNKYLYACLLVLVSTGMAFAGNPDRQGQAGAFELVLNPWARSAGLHSMNTSSVRGLEAMRLNIAGLSRINNTEVAIGHMIYLQGTGINMNAIGLAQRMSKNGVLGISLYAMDFGEIKVTNDDQPEGSGAYFSPSFFHLSMGYSQKFENKVSVGAMITLISESTAGVKSFGFGIDAGVQYVAGDQDEFKFGLSLRNVGSPMKFGGDGLTHQVPGPDPGNPYEITVSKQAASFELPSMLNIGLSYDFLFGSKNRLTALGNFTSNAFSRDQLGIGFEYSFNDMFALRAAYKAELGKIDLNEIGKNIETGLSAGVSLDVPLSKKNQNIIGIDYAYRATNPFNGTHNLCLRISL